MATDTTVSQKQYAAARYQNSKRSTGEISEKLSELIGCSESLSQVLRALPKAQQPTAEGVALLSEVLSFLGKCDADFEKSKK